MLELDGGWIPGQSASTHVNRYDTREENVQRGRKEKNETKETSAQAESRREEEMRLQSVNE